MSNGTIGSAGLRTGNSVTAQFTDASTNPSNAYAGLDLTSVQAADTNTTSNTNEIGTYILNGGTAPTLAAGAGQTALRNYFGAILDDALSVDPTGITKSPQKEIIARTLEMADKAGIKKEVLNDMQSDLQASADYNDNTKPSANNKALKFIGSQLEGDSKDTNSTTNPTSKGTAALITAISPADPVSPTYDTVTATAGAANGNVATALANNTAGTTADGSNPALKNLKDAAADKEAAKLAEAAEGIIAALKADPSDANALQKMKNFMSMANSLGTEMQQALARALAKDGMLEDFKAAADVALKNENNRDVKNALSNAKGFYGKIDAVETALPAGNGLATAEALGTLFGDDKDAKGQFLGDIVNHGPKDGQKNLYQKAFATANAVDGSSVGQCHDGLNAAATSIPLATQNALATPIGAKNFFVGGNAKDAAPSPSPTPSTAHAAGPSAADTPVVSASTIANARAAAGITPTADADDSVTSSTPTTGQTAFANALQTPAGIASLLKNPNAVDTQGERDAIANAINKKGPGSLSETDQQALASVLTDKIKNSPTTEPATQLSNYSKLATNIAVSNPDSTFSQNLTNQLGTLATNDVGTSGKVQASSVLTDIQNRKDEKDYFGAATDGLKSLLQFIGGAHSSAPMLTAITRVDTNSNFDDSGESLPTIQAWATAMGVDPHKVKVEVKDGENGEDDTIIFSGLSDTKGMVSSTFSVDAGTFSAPQVQEFKDKFTDVGSNWGSKQHAFSGLFLPSGVIVQAE